MRQNNLFMAVVILASAVLLTVFAVAALSPGDVGPREDSLDDRVVVPLKKPTVSFGNPSSGPKEAPVTVVSFGDYQCVPCATMNEALVQLRQEFPSDVRVVWKDYPDDAVHPLATASANAARCAGDQGKFWEYHAVLMSQQGQLLEINFPTYATAMGLDGALFQACLDADRNVPLVERDVIEGQRLGISATPTTFVGERRVVGAVDYDQLRTFVTAELDRLGKTPTPAPKPAPAPVPNPAPAQ